MNIRTFTLILTYLGAGFTAFAQQKITQTSPDKKIVLEVETTRDGAPAYSISHQGTKILSLSRLGLVTREVNYTTGMTLDTFYTDTHDETWNTVWGEEESIRDHHNMLKTFWKTSNGKSIGIRFKVFNNGVGFRYELKGDKGASVVILDEKTEFALTADHTTWWAPSDWDSNEHTYSNTKISQIDATKHLTDIEPFNQFIPDVHAVQTPVVMKMANGIHVAIAEAALVDYGALHLKADRKNFRFAAFVVPTADSTVKSVNTLPFNTPWRTILINKNAGGLLTNRTILNLNEPCPLVGDMSWIKPQKYVGIWWEMHVGKGSWDYRKDGVPHGKHSANTQNVKKYIDFAAKYGFDGVLVEGWNEGWDAWFNTMKPEIFNFTQPYPDYDMTELAAYAKSKKVQIIMHHETSSAIPSYERQMEDAYDYMRRFGMNSVKTGYVGFVQPKGEWHDGQRMINHYNEVARRTFLNQIMVDMHEPVRPSGLHRTWPNYMSSEAARGMEYNAWSKGCAPSHVITLPFTRLLGGPMDFTPGIFETRMNTYDPKKKEIIQSTVANQLALYVTMYSPMQMAADLPENYEKRLDAFQFIRDVPVDWSETRVLNAEIGDFLTVARRERGKNNWFIGSITDEKARSLDITLDFLKAGKKYEAIIYADGENAHYQNNPYPVAIRKVQVKKGSKLNLKLAAGGGCAVSIREK